jgi:hypothetical protein
MQGRAYVARSGNPTSGNIVRKTFGVSTADFVATSAGWTLTHLSSWFCQAFDLQPISLLGKYLRQRIEWLDRAQHGPNTQHCRYDPDGPDIRHRIDD